MTQPSKFADMQHRRTTFSKFIIEAQRRKPNPDAELTGLLNDIQTACKFIASAVSRGSLESAGGWAASGAGEDAPKGLEAIANDIMLRECEWGGKLSGMVSPHNEAPYQIPGAYPRGHYLLTFEALEGASDIDVNVSVGTIFSVLRAPEGSDEPAAGDFLRPGVEQVAAGFALYGPTSIIVMTLGAGVHGFTLDREIGAYTLTHPDMRIPEETVEFAIDASNERYWEPPVRHYVEECVAGQAGARGADFNMRWVDSLATEVNRILVRGGLFICPRDTKDGSKTGRRHLLYEANPMALIVEEAGGAASTGRERILDIVPTGLHQYVPVILGSRREVERLIRYHESYDRGEELVFETPLFKTRSLFRTVS
jgi:fructose-1,6-bisphosphatase I